MSMPSVPQQSILKVLAAIDPDLAIAVEEDEIKSCLAHGVAALDSNMESVHGQPQKVLDRIQTRLQQIDDETELLRRILAQESSRLYQVYYRNADYLILERPYTVSDILS